MSAVQKIFIVINLILAAVFVTLQGVQNTHKADYRKRLEQLGKKYEDDVKRLQRVAVDKENENKAVREAYRREVDEHRRTRGELAKQQDRSVKVTKELEKLKYLWESFNVTVAGFNETFRQKDEGINRLAEENKNLSQQVRDWKTKAQRDRNDANAYRILAARKDDRITGLKDQISFQGQELKKYKQTIEVLIDKGIDVWGLAARKTPPGLDGKIVAVNNEVQTVMVNVGTDSGVYKGLHFTVYTGDKYVGKVVVEEVFKDMASARIDPRYLRGTIQEGQNVSTRIR